MSYDRIILAETTYFQHGEVSEWFKELVLKTSDPARDQGFESLPLRHFIYSLCRTEDYSSGEEAPLLRE